MPEIRLKIKGVHYAVHSDYNPKNGDVSTEEMEQRTVERLKDLDARRPKVILVPEPDNPVMTTSFPRGISTSTFFRLLTRAPLIIIFLLLSFILLSAINQSREFT